MKNKTDTSALYNKIAVYLTKEECISLVDYIDTYLIGNIQSDGTFDNLVYLENILNAKQAMKSAVYDAKAARVD